jgi:hypothetical protein
MDIRASFAKLPAQKAFATRELIYHPVAYSLAARNPAHNSGIKVPKKCEKVHIFEHEECDKAVHQPTEKQRLQDLKISDPTNHCHNSSSPWLTSAS